MGVLTEQTQQLCQGIVAWRNERHALLAELARENQNRQAAVSTLCMELSRQRQEMGQRSQALRASFLSGLRAVVAAQQEALRADRAGARLAWEGGPAAPSFHREMPARAAHLAREAPRKGGKRERHH